MGIFSFKNGGITVAEASVPSPRPARALRMYAEASQSRDILTGIAVTNASPTTATVRFELTTMEGTPVGLVGSVSVAGNGQIAAFLNQISGFESLPLPFQGILRISTDSTAGVSVIGLRGRSNERGDFLITTTPAADESIPGSGAETLFPHFVDGGGYSTQFILFSAVAGRASSGSISFFTQSGQPFNVVFK